MKIRCSKINKAQRGNVGPICTLQLNEGGDELTL